MASEEVIELGSSDDEAEPAPKKIKSALNAMVHFPNKDKILKPINPTLPPLQKVLAAGAVTITNVRSLRGTVHTNKSVLNGRPVQKVPQKILQKMPIVNPIPFTPIQIQNTKQHLQHIHSSMSINPLNFVKNQEKVRAQVPKVKIPPGITVKRTVTGQKKIPVPYVAKNRSFISVKPLVEKIITTVEIDDEAPVISGTSPQWYLRPEEQTQHFAKEVSKESKDKQVSVIAADTSLEVANNTEPNPTKFEQIIIEDSPVKPVQLKRSHEVASQLAITIEDSPIKVIGEPSNASSSDNKEQGAKTPNSKKRLEYPKADENNIIPDIESNVKIDSEKSEDVHNAPGEKAREVINLKKPEIAENTKEIEKPHEPIDASEFNPVYQKFIDLCFELENSEDMRKIVEKKIKAYYRQCPKEYVESEEFTDMVTSKIYAMKAGPDKMYLYIKDVVDELNLLRKTAKAAGISSKEYEEKDSDNCEDEHDRKRRRQIHKLDKTIKKLHRAVQKLEEQEVEFDDEEDSVYLLTERYKERLIKVHAKYCQLTNTKMPSETRIQIEARPGQPIGPVRRLEKWVNRKVPVGKPLPFPDFHDVLRCVREANEEDGLGWNEADIMEEARDLFTRCGRKLQRRRQENEWRIAASRISNDMSSVDPAQKSDVLRKRLEENKALAAKKETEVLNKYADKQNQLRLEAEEIGDKEADESPVESEDDEVNDDSNALENKQKRKERLKRLLHEKTKKTPMSNENISLNALKDDEKGMEDKAEDKSLKEYKENKGGINPSISDTEENENNIKNVRNDNDIQLISQNISGAQTAYSNDCKQEQNNHYDKHDVDSEIDELHLLQKLYSENEMNSSVESDSDSPIAISDTLDSDSEADAGNKHGSIDIISIENSSYSESEITKDECIKEIDHECVKNKVTDSSPLVNSEIELPSTSKRKIEEYDENILLASSDEEIDNMGKNNKCAITCTSTTSNENKTINDDIINETIDHYEENSENCIAITINEVISHDNDTDNLMTCDKSDKIPENDKQDDKILLFQQESEGKFVCEESVSAAIILENEHSPKTIDSTNNDAANVVVNGEEDDIHQNENTSENEVSTGAVDSNTEALGNNFINDRLSNVTDTEMMPEHHEDNLEANKSLQKDCVLEEASSSRDITSQEKEINEHELIGDV